MQFNVKALFFAMFSTAVLASPAQVEKRACRTVFFPDTCAPGEIACNGAGSITLCCTGSC
ncbi:hypothetical protein BXZ70DRAFT_1011997 [Cristinia sonorae]|uniref:Uncharacterized protein n=1 Tax=Cristinia sonorae TaxID=1940300 RepID=A0A8K0UGD7_9AGAR|nr:hypothetical protein BXZ70DRAFT_1011997 [Cristinia sonorae]